MWWKNGEKMENFYRLNSVLLTHKEELIMKLNLIEKIVLKIFKKTFDKVYMMGLTDSFNFCNSSSFTSPNLVK